MEDIDEDIAAFIRDFADHPTVNRLMLDIIGYKVTVFRSAALDYETLDSLRYVMELPRGLVACRALVVKILEQKPILRSRDILTAIQKIYAYALNWAEAHQGERFNPEIHLEASSTSRSQLMRTRIAGHTEQMVKSSEELQTKPMERYVPSAPQVKPNVTVKRRPKVQAQTQILEMTRALTALQEQLQGMVQQPATEEEEEGQA
jgi:hypothetical protein